MINYVKISIGVFFVLLASRFIPHPPNFTSLIALSFYVPALLGIRFLPIVIISFMVTDIFFGFHNFLIFTWGSVFLIGLISLYFKQKPYYRILGSISGATLFFILTNFGVWIDGSYGYTINGLLTCYVLALPFFTNSLISTILYSLLIETLFKLSMKNIFFKKILSK